ncbi:methionine adenosyltransferase [Membranihabitans marinus]|uniref:methionine adenosyltransferase n=1 Tax=Membranihabitans marinus TaxID=1227546 RepID=UPI001F0084FE|nr:methionine adenosyltransferase [Membranihabitans marinus]
MSYFFTSESVSEGHPDKVADQISDAVLDAYLNQDPKSRVACETMVSTGLVMVAGEVRSTAVIDLQKIVRDTIKKIGYTKADYRFDYNSCAVINALHEQSEDIAMGVDEKEGVKDIGAGDQGMMFGYATNETGNYLPLGLDIAHKMLFELSELRRENNEIKYLRPDAKSQVTIEYSDDHQPLRINTIVLSTQHDAFDEDDSVMLQKIDADIKNILMPRVIAQYDESVQNLFTDKITYHINPTGKFVIGGPHGDTGLTGRKIIVDTYGGKGAHGGGAFSGKDSTKVDRSAAYATRHIARNLVAAGIADKCLVQVAYAIGVSKPVGLFIDTYGTSKVELKDSEIAEKVLELFDLRPSAIIETYQLNKPIFSETAAYGHMGRIPSIKSVELKYNGQVKVEEIETFSWEKEDRVDDIKAAFNLG